MVSTVDEQACWTLPAVPDTARRLRARVTAFAAAAGAPRELQDGVALAVSETVTNAIVHAYAGARETGTVRVRCWVSQGNSSSRCLTTCTRGRSPARSVGRARSPMS